MQVHFLNSLDGLLFTPSAYDGSVRNFENVLRLLIIILVLVLLFVLLKRLFSGKTPGAGETRIAKMVQCDYCRLYIPHSTAIKHAEHFYCCDEHKESATDNTP